MSEAMNEAKGMQETLERAAAGWWDAWARSPVFLAKMGKMLEAQLGVRKVAGKAVDEWLEAWGVPSGREHDRLLDRVAALEARVAELERAAGVCAAGAGKAGAGPKAS